MLAGNSATFRLNAYTEGNENKMKRVIFYPVAYVVNTKYFYK